MSKDLNIHDLKLVPLNQIIDERGAVLHYLKSNSELFKGFGEAYFSKINTGVIKGWKLHYRVHQNFCVPFGSVLIVFYDGREDSPTFGAMDEVLLNDLDEYKLLSIPPGIWYSFKCVSDHYALLSNIINATHDPSESRNLPLNNQEIPYEWK